MTTTQSKSGRWLASMGRELTVAENRVYCDVSDYGDAHLGVVFTSDDVFPNRNNQDNASRRTFRKLITAGAFNFGDWVKVEDRGYETRLKRVS